MYLLRSGRVQLSRDHEAIVDHVTPGCFFGEKFLLPTLPAKQVARSLTPVRVNIFPKAKLLRQLQTDRRFALRLVRNLALRLDRYEQAIRDFVTEPAEARLARLLLRLAPPRPALGWVRLPVSPTNPELARMIGTTRERVSHFVNQFQQRGWLRRQDGLWIHSELLKEFVEVRARL